MTTPHRLFLCAHLTCRAQVLVCGRCDRGQVYCAGECALRARRQCVRDAGRRYQDSRAGRLAHARRSRCYRARQQQKAASSCATILPPPALAVAIVTHQGSSHSPADALLPLSVTAPVLLTMSCHFCGCTGSIWVRLGPLRRSLLAVLPRLQ